MRVIRNLAAVAVAFCGFVAAAQGVPGLHVERLSAKEIQSQKSRVAAGVREISPGLYELDDTSVDKFISDNPTAAILFYAFWCHWCKELLPRYHEAVGLLRAKKSPLVFGQIDASRNLNAAEKYDIRAYPTLVLFLDGVAHEYGGGRQTWELATWLERHVDTDPTVQTVESLEKLLAVTQLQPLVLGRFAAAAGPKHHETFLAASRHIDRAQFAEVDSPLVLNYLQTKLLLPPSANQDDFILLLNQHYKRDPENEPPAVLFSGKFDDEKELVAFVQRYAFPLITEFNYESASMILHDGRPLIVLLRESKGSTEMEASFKAAAQAFRGSAIFVVAENVSYTRRLMSVLGYDAEEETLPLVRGLKNLKNDAQTHRLLKFKFNPSVASLNSFVQQLLDGKLQPWMRSEDPPVEPEAAGSVKTLVASTYDQEVLQTERDVVVMFYAPWCGHCKRLEPTYERVAQLLANQSSVNIMRLDSTRNELPVPISGFPTLMLFTGKDRTAHTYTGERSVDAIITWIALQSELKQFDATSVLKGHTAAAIQEGVASGPRAWESGEL